MYEASHVEHNNYKEALIESILESRMYGLSNIVRVKNLFLRIFWIICFLTSALTCACLIGLEFVKFFDYKVDSKISIKYEASTEFPGVVICNLG